MIYVLATGGFDPIHAGHIDFLQCARTYGDKLIVGLNSDAWLIRKKGQFFMTYFHRSKVLEALSCVNSVIGFNDDDGSATDAVDRVRRDWLGSNDRLIVVNGGDRSFDNLPSNERSHVFNDTVHVFNVGGSKTMSSSYLLDRWRRPERTERGWGQWTLVDERWDGVEHVKVKLVEIHPDRSMSEQTHEYRDERWIPVNGRFRIEMGDDVGSGHVYEMDPLGIHGNASLTIPRGKWHRAFNPYGSSCQVIEIQRGKRCIEEDIERHER